jgi:hypothetical protein
LHGLGNELFVLGGRLATLAGEPEQLARGKAEAQRALDQIRGTLEVLKLLGCEPSSRGDRHPAMALLGQLVEVVRIPLRERGLRAELKPASAPGRMHVDGARFAGIVVHGLLRTLARLPQGYLGTVVLAVVALDGGTIEFTLGVRAEASQLPFPIPFDLVATELAQAWEGHGVHFSRLADGSGLSCRLASQDPGVAGAGKVRDAY